MEKHLKGSISITDFLTFDIKRKNMIFASLKKGDTIAFFSPSAPGTWEQIFYGEFDGRRKKRVLVKIIGG